MERNLRKERVGLVVSDMMDKTVVVSVELKATHPLYKKTITTTKTYKKVTKLKSKKTYYVQVRTYKTVGGKRYYSSWSTRKYVKTA